MTSTTPTTDRPLRVLALNGSPRALSSSTVRILEPLLEGMRQAGAQTELVHVARLKLKPCTGCYTCWVRTPGTCVFNDPMAAALRAYSDADLVVFGTPLYHYTMSGTLKTFIDRTLPSSHPWLVPHPEVPSQTTHPKRWRGPSKMMLVSPAGFPEVEVFENLVSTFKFMAKRGSIEYVGEILRPGGEPLSQPALQPFFEGYYEHVRAAGRAVIETGGISATLQHALREDLFPGGKQAFINASEHYWGQKMDRFQLPIAERHLPVLQPSAEPGRPAA